MDTYSVRKSEQRLAQLQQSLALWRGEHERHKDAASHRNYSRALVRVHAVCALMVVDQGFAHLDEELKQLEAEIEHIDDFLKTKE